MMSITMRVGPQEALICMNVLSLWVEHSHVCTSYVFLAASEAYSIIYDAIFSWLLRWAKLR